MELGSGDTSELVDHRDLPTLSCFPSESNKWRKLVDRFGPCCGVLCTSRARTGFRDYGSST